MRGFVSLSRNKYDRIKMHTSWLTEKREDKKQDNWSIREMINSAIAISNADFFLSHTDILTHSLSLSLSFLFDTDRFFFVTHYRFCHFLLNCLCLFFASRQWWRLTIHHLLSGGDAARLSSHSFSFGSCRSLSLAFFSSHYYWSRRLVTAKSVVVMHPLERQLLNIPVLLFFFMRLP